MHLEFYANLRDDSQSPSSTKNLNNYGQNYCSTEGYTSSKVEDPMIQRETSAPEEESELSDHMQAYKEKLDTITGDILMRCQSGDCNFISGLNRFIREYGKMKASICPTPAIAHALHVFGKDDSKFSG